MSFLGKFFGQAAVSSLAAILPTYNDIAKNLTHVNTLMNEMSMELSTVWQKELSAQAEAIFKSDIDQAQSMESQGIGTIVGGTLGIGSAAYQYSKINSPAIKEVDRKLDQANLFDKKLSEKPTDSLKLNGENHDPKKPDFKLADNKAGKAGDNSQAENSVVIRVEEEKLENKKPAAVADENNAKQNKPWKRDDSRFAWALKPEPIPAKQPIETHEFFDPATEKLFAEDPFFKKSELPALKDQRTSQEMAAQKTQVQDPQEKTPNANAAKPAIPPKAEAATTPCKVEDKDLAEYKNQLIRGDHRENFYKADGTTGPAKLKGKKLSEEAEDVISNLSDDERTKARDNLNLDQLHRDKNNATLAAQAEAQPITTLCSAMGTFADGWGKVAASQSITDQADQNCQKTVSGEIAQAERNMQNSLLQTVGKVTEDRQAYLSILAHVVNSAV